MTDQGATASLHELVPFAGTLGIEMLSSAPAEVRGRVAWAESLCTVGGALNGGVLMALADNTGALCAFLNLPSRGPRRPCDGDLPAQTQAVL